MAGWNEEVLRSLRNATLIQEGTFKGTLYNASRRVTGIAGGATLDSIFITGDKPVLLFERVIGRTGEGVSADIFRNPTYAGGTPASVFSTNDITGDGDLSSIQLLAGPTVTATGEQSVATIYSIGPDGASTQGGEATLTQPLLMLPNSSYLFRITNLDSQNNMTITAFIAWIEGGV